MRLAVIRKQAGAADSATRGEVAEATETAFDVPTSTVAKVSAILGAILTLSQILSSVLSSVTGAYSSRAQVEISKEVVSLVEDNFRVQLLQRVLEEADEKKRAASLRLLLAAGLLRDDGGQLARLVGAQDYVPPQWGPRPLEPLKDTLPLARGGAAPPSPGGQSGGGNENANRNSNGNANKNANANANANNSNANSAGAGGGG